MRISKLGWLCALLACSIDKPVDPASQIKCSSDAHCPDGWSCTVTGLCASTESACLEGVDGEFVPVANGNKCPIEGALGVCIDGLCEVSRCGDDILDTRPPLLEECDGGPDNSDTEVDACRTNCKLARCGDTVIDTGEVCDDGNNLSDDDCSGDCTSNEQCGNGQLETYRGEECDCGGVSGPLPAAPSCQQVNGPGPRGSCRDDCKIARCGNNLDDPMIMPPEVCDDGNLISGDGCSGDCLSRETCGNFYIDAQAGELCDDGNFRSRDGCATDCFREAPIWQQFVDDFARGRTVPGLVYDPVRDVTVLFGGIGFTGPRNDTALWDGVRWTPLQTLNAPVPRAEHRMVWDSMRQRIVLFGGVFGVNYDDTWVFDGTDWTELSPATRPPARHAHGMAYDVARDRVVVFGGYDGTSEVDDTWEFDGVNWTFRPTTTQPPARWRTHMAHDPVRNVSVLYGGRAGSSRLDDTWEWNGSVWTDTMLSVPAARERFHMAYDEADGAIIIFGGISPFNNELWRYDGAWTQRMLANPPPARMDLGFAVDTTRDVVIVYSGTALANVLSDVWELEMGVWVDKTPPERPPPRNQHAMAYDSDRSVGVLYGGAGITVLGDVDDTWEFDGFTWSRTLTTSPAGLLFGHSMAYYPPDQVTILFGGQWAMVDFNGTFEYDGLGWVDAMPLMSPPARRWAGITFDSWRNRLVLFGGCDGPITVGSCAVASEMNDTWEYDGTTWLPITPMDSPSPRAQHAIAFDELRGVTVLFAGERDRVQLADTWEYDGMTWVETTPAQSPRPRRSLAMTYHADRGAILMTGGLEAPEFLGDTWEYAGGRWTEVVPVLEPPSALRSALFYDASRRQTVRFGGFPAVLETHLFSYTSPTPDEWCNNSLDDDGDTYADCDDPDCNTHPACTAREVCDDATDNDGDLLVDCADPNCGGAPCGGGLRCRAELCQ